MIARHGHQEGDGSDHTPKLRFSHLLAISSDSPSPIGSSSNLWLQRALSSTLDSRSIRCL